MIRVFIRLRLKIGLELGLGLELVLGSFTYYITLRGYDGSIFVILCYLGWRRRIEKCYKKSNFCPGQGVSKIPELRTEIRKNSSKSQFRTRGS